MEPSHPRLRQKQPPGSRHHPPPAPLPRMCCRAVYRRALPPPWTHTRANLFFTRPVWRKKRGVSRAHLVFRARAAQSFAARRARSRSQAGDIGGTTELVAAMTEFCWEAKDLPKLNETIAILAKRRAQLKQAVTAM
eukprot:2936954-Prymnesium_polylepis.1